jgi:hypothetical protein
MKSAKVETRRIEVRREFGPVGGEISTISATVELDEATGKARSQVYIPYTWLDVEKMSDIVRLLHQVVDWTEETKTKLLAEQRQATKAS